MEQFLTHFFNYVNKSQPLPEGAITELRQLIQLETFQKNDCLLKIGEPSTKMYFVCTGCLRGETAKLVQGDTVLQSSRFMMETEIVFNVDGFVGEAGSTENIYTLEPTKALTLLRDDFFAIGRKYPALLETALLLAFESKKQVNKRLSGLKDGDTEAQVIWLIENEPEWIRRVPDKYVASFIDTTPENFSRIKRKLRDAGKSSTEAAKQ